METGSTLRENNLEILETIVPLSARLIANRASYFFRREQVDELVRKLAGKEE